MPRILPIIAFIGAPLLLASDIAIFFGVYDHVSPIAALAALPGRRVRALPRHLADRQGLQAEPYGAAIAADLLVSGS